MLANAVAVAILVAAAVAVVAVAVAAVVVAAVVVVAVVVVILVVVPEERHQSSKPLKNYPIQEMKPATVDTV